MMLTRMSHVSTGRSAAARPVAHKFTSRRPVRVVAYKEDEKTSFSTKVSEQVNKVTENQVPVTEVIDRINSTTQADRTPPGPAYEAPLLVPALTRRREVFVGRLAQVGFFAACFMEILSPEHAGVLGQIRGWTGLSSGYIQLGVGAVLLHGLLAILWPGSPTYDKDNVQDFLQRPRGPAADDESNLLKNPAKLLNPPLGLNVLGFSKKNELFNGRMAMLGFLAAIINEQASGGLGPLGQLAWWAGVTPSNQFYMTAGLGLAVWTVALAALTVIPVAGAPQPDDDTTY